MFSSDIGCIPVLEDKARPSTFTFKLILSERFFHQKQRCRLSCYSIQFTQKLFNQVLKRSPGLTFNNLLASPSALDLAAEYVEFREKL